MDRYWGHSRSPNRSNYYENESSYRDYREGKRVQWRTPRSGSYKFPSDFQGSSSRRHDYPSSSRDSRSRSRERTFSRGNKRSYSQYRDDVDFNYNHAPERRQMSSSWNNDDDKASPDRDYPNQTQPRPYEMQEPNRTVMVQGLGAEVTENQIREAIEKSGFAPIAVRLVKKYNSPRGFAFVEFTNITEATSFMQYQQGLLKLEDNQTVVLRYSIQKYDKEDLEKKAEDWFCVLCGAQNFRRRTECYKCQTPRKTSECAEGEDEIALGITATIILRKLDTLTTAESVVKALSVAIPDLMNKISAIIIGKDHLTGVSRGVCYLKVESIVDALVVKDALTNRPTPIKIDGKAVLIAYCKYNMGNVQEPYEHSAYTELANANQTDADSNVTASAKQLGADEPIYQNYSECYSGYYPQQVGTSSSQMDQTNAAAAVAQSAIQQRHGSKPKVETRSFSVPTGADGKTYPMPDSSKFTADITSGLYFDFTTGLHFDPASGYYWNSTIQKYMYYSTEKMTYLLVPEAQPVAQSRKTKNNKGGNMSVAKKVMKDMERWEKMVNQKKDKEDSNSSNCTDARSADIGYSVLENRALHKHEFDTSSPSTSTLVPNYSTSDSSDEEALDLDESSFLDLATFICKLCKRKLSSKELLQKHAQLSELHKSNLEQLKASMKTDIAVYRDRAEERRMKHPDKSDYAPRARKVKRNVSSLLPDPVGPIGVENVGNRMLQRMGWSDGQGLGRTNQGRTSVVEVGQRNTTAGLGTKMPVLNGNESYKDSVRKTFYARFKELQDE